jgi:hypothetical protein
MHYKIIMVKTVLNYTTKMVIKQQQKNIKIYVTTKILSETKI